MSKWACVPDSEIIVHSKAIMPPALLFTSQRESNFVCKKCISPSVFKIISFDKDKNQRPETWVLSGLPHSKPPD